MACRDEKRYPYFSGRKDSYLQGFVNSHSSHSLTFTVWGKWAGLKEEQARAVVLGTYEMSSHHLM